MRTSILLYFIFTVFFSFKSIAQKSSNVHRDRLKEAEEFIENSNLGQAMEIYMEMVENNPSDTIAITKLGEIHYRLHNVKESIKWYEQVLDRPMPPGSSVDPHHYFNYAELMLMEEHSTDALYWYERYATTQPKDSRTARRIDGIKRMDELKRSPPLYRHDPVSFNSNYDDFSPAYYNNGLVFVSGRKESTENKEDKDTEYLDLYFAAFDENGGFKKPVKFSESINTNLHEGPVVFYDNNQKMIFTRNIVTRKKSSEESIILHLQLFSSKNDSVNAAWQSPKSLSINNKSYSMGHPAINSAGSRLYFSSNLPGGYGGTDLYVSEITNGNWSTPKNLGSDINTEGNEMFPFVCGDSLLYFASDGHPGIGGLDIYKVSINGGVVTNMGYPINSSRDDFGLITNGDDGYFSTSRNSNDKRKNDDIYHITLLTRKQEVPIAIDSIQLPDSTLREEVYYTVQILALRNSRTVHRKFLKDLKGVLKHDGKDGFHRYTYGRYSTPEEANEILSKIKLKGYHDAFIRREKTYIELSEREGMEVDVLYDISKKSK